MTNAFKKWKEKNTIKIQSHNQKQNGWSHESPNHHASVPASPSLREHVSHQPKWTPSLPIIPRRWTLEFYWFFFFFTNVLQSPRDERKLWTAMQRQQCIGLENQPYVPGTKLGLVLFIVLFVCCFLNKKNHLTWDHIWKYNQHFAVFCEIYIWYIDEKWSLFHYCQMIH